jgi:hypothetical protein
MWELLTGEEPYANKHCASIIGKHPCFCIMNKDINCNIIYFSI